MPQVTYVQPGGTGQTFEIENGLSVMRGALNNGVEGIVAECGGACACATCQVFVNDGWIDRVAPAGPLELSMIGESDLDGSNLRLSCQIELTPMLDGLIVHIPEQQF